MAKQLFILDGHALVYRAFYAVRDLTNSKGQPTNAVFGFVNILRKLLKVHDPEFITVCFDSKGPTLRQKRYEEYKIQRPPMPDELRSQVPIIKDILKAYGIKLFEKQGYEADDLIGTLTANIKKKDLELVVVSEDKDLYQLLNGHVKIFSVRKEAMLDHAAITKKLGFEATRIVDFLALAGDKSDNIPGVAGVGEVTARNLINEFETLEGIYKGLDNIEKAKLREKLVSDRDNAFLSKELATIDCDVPVDYAIEDMKLAQPDRQALFKIFKDLEFRRLAEEYSGEARKEVKVSQSSLTAKEIDGVLKQALKQKQVAVLFDEEVILLAVRADQVYAIQFSDIKKLKPLFENEKVCKVVWDIKSVLTVCDEASIKLKGVYDCLLGAYLVDPSGANDNVAEVIWKHLKQSIEKDDLTAQAAGMLALYAHVVATLRERSLTKLYDELELPLAYVIYAMECEGVHLDLKFLAKMSKKCEKDIAALTSELYEEAGEEFNINSPKQLSKVLFDTLGLPPIKKTKTGYSTDEGVLTTLAFTHAFPAKVLEYRHLSKLKSTYIDALPKLVDAKNYLHAEFVQTGAETGRLSSRNPNLQNIPIRTDLGRQIRKSIIPSDKDHIILAADYSQIELRVLAHLSKDKNLIKAFKAGQDIHQFTASLMHGVEMDEVTTEMRYSAKRINFGIVYGMGAFGLSKDLNITPYEAQQFIDKYFARYPAIKKFMDEQIAFCEKNGYVETIMKRRRYIPEIKSSNGNIKQFAQRQAINTPVQGTAADIIKLAMINIDQAITNKKLKSKMIMSVHDELVFDVLKSETKKMAELVRTEMEGALKLSVPIDVSVKTGDNWLEMNNV